MSKLGKLGIVGAAVVAGGLAYNAITAEGTPKLAREVAEFVGLDDCARNLPNGPEVKACRRYKEQVLDVMDAQEEAADAAAEAEKEKD